MRYARRDLGTKYGILRNSNGNPKYYVDEKVFIDFPEEEKEKWSVIIE